MPATLADRWNPDPLLALGLAAALVLVWGPATRQRAAGVSAVLLLALLFATPLCALAVALFSARTAQHLAILLLVCPLLALALDRASGPPPSRPWLGLATAGHAAAIWAWHLPPVYALALSSDAAYWALQLALILSGAAFWRALWHAAMLPAAGAIAAIMAQMGIIGALLVFAPVPLFAPHLDTTLAWGLAPLADQQLAGLLMWVVPLPAYLLAAVRAFRLGTMDGAGPVRGPAWRS